MKLEHVNHTDQAVQTFQLNFILHVLYACVTETDANLIARNTAGWRLAALLICIVWMCYRIETVTSAVDETCTETTHKKRKKDHDNVDEPSIAPCNNNITSTQTTGNKNRRKKKNIETKLPTISDDRLRAYGINPKKFKYFHQKKLLKEQR